VTWINFEFAMLSLSGGKVALAVYLYRVPRMDIFMILKEHRTPT
jgi:hypothetical protein